MRGLLWQQGGGFRELGAIGAWFRSRIRPCGFRFGFCPQIRGQLMVANFSFYQIRTIKNSKPNKSLSFCKRTLACQVRKEG